MQQTFGRIDLSQFRKGTQTLIIGDVRNVLAEFPHNSVDLIYSDESYNDLESHRAKGTTTRLKESKGSDMKWYDTIDYEQVIPFYSYILKSGRHWYFYRPSINEESLRNWCRLIDPSKGLCHEYGFVIRKAIPIAKPSGMGYSWRSSHEYVVFAYKDGDFRQLNDYALKDYQDEIIWPSHKTKIHDSQKPIAIAKRVLMNSSNEGELVLEPFAGSFGSAEVNHQYKLNRIVIGIEKNQEIANKTIDYFKSQEIPLDVIQFNESH